MPRSQRSPLVAAALLFALLAVLGVVALATADGRLFDLANRHVLVVWTNEILPI